MELKILDKEYKLSGILDAYISAIWTDRYQKAGDFEIYLPADKKYADILPIDGYLSQDGSPYLMIIEDMKITTDAENGDKMLFTGRSLESILDRRIVWDKIGGKVFKLQDAVEKVLNENAINPSDPNRKIPGLQFVRSDDPNVTEHYVKGEVQGQELYETICNWCQQHNIGWRILPDFKGNLFFNLYYGYDRSYNQNYLPYVIFSPEFENLVSSEYYTTRKELKTVCLVEGPIDPNDASVVHAMKVYLKDGERSGFDRRETYVDMTSSNLPEPEYQIVDDPDSEDYGKNIMGYNPITNADNVPIPTEEYINEYLEAVETLQATMDQKGRQQLMQHIITSAFTGDVSAQRQFVYGRDFFIGDTVTVKNKYGIEGTLLIDEVVRTVDEKGDIIVPTFVVKESHDHD